ncbi:MAG TPA: hypothetical protein VGZ90_13000 [Puia sp.]|jgi:hypothetical protein|nr:hypothetical protein [Puia sp.]
MSEEENIKSEGPLLNSPQITPESSNPSQVKVEELSESDQLSSIENMEVHHHPDLHHKKKHLKEYFLEFLMIFLAVTLGFIAENIREHIGEKQKEEEYIKSFIANVKDDTAQITDITEFSNKEIRGLDSFLLISREDFTNPGARQLFYYFSEKLFFSEALFKSNDATLVQLRNSGGFRLIQKDHVADSIALYDARINFIYDQGSYYNTYYKEVRELMDEIIDLSVFRDTSFYKNHSFTKKLLPLLRNENEKIRTFFNKVAQYRIAAYYYCNSPNYLRGQQEFASRLIIFLKKEYEIE